MRFCHENKSKNGKIMKCFLSLIVLHLFTFVSFAVFFYVLFIYVVLVSDLFAIVTGVTFSTFFFLSLRYLTRTWNPDFPIFSCYTFIQLMRIYRYFFICIICVVCEFCFNNKLIFYSYCSFLCSVEIFLFFPLSYFHDNL